MTNQNNTLHENLVYNPVKRKIKVLSIKKANISDSFNLELKK